MRVALDCRRDRAPPTAASLPITVVGVVLCDPVGRVRFVVTAVL